ncbi:MAG: hypothetical protein LC128_11735 [Chitinophagales bacterium]|nr:hypothetical protein [Chitinophagales bacterium]
MKISQALTLSCLLLLHWTFSNAQCSISIQCKEINLSVSGSLKCSPVEEDDPADLAEAYSFFIGFYGNTQSDNQRFELRFPSRIATYHWAQASVDDETDSLYAWLSYDVNPEVYGHLVQAFPKDFTITVNRYDNKKGGIVEGKFEGTMAAYLPWSHQNILIPVKGNFQTTRTGRSYAECRKQRRAEKAVISNAIHIFENTLIQPLQQAGWKTEYKAANNTLIANNPYPFRPIFLCSSIFHLKLILDPGSAFSKALEDSANYYGKQADHYGALNSEGNNPKYQKLVTEATKNIIRIQALQNAEIGVEINSPFLMQDNKSSDKNKSTTLQIPGVAYVRQSYKAPSNELALPEENTMLFFGNWAGKNMRSGSDTRYPFIHKTQSPYIENIVITIKAPASVANKIIKAIDWSKLNYAISK